MPSFGEKLKLEREKRKITIDAISSATKISTRMLHALEDEKFNQLPGGIFNKGFVRAYAREVGLDEDQAVADYMQASGEAPPPRSDAANRDNARAQATREQRESRDAREEDARLEIRAEVASRQLPWGIFAAILLVVALALSLWSHRRHEHEKERMAEETAAATSIAQPETSPSTQQTTTPEPVPNAAQSAPSPKSTTTAHPASQSPAGSTTQAAPTQSSTKSTSPTTQSSAQPNTATTALPSSISATGSAFTVIVRAREQSWLSITVDGKSQPHEILEAGSEHAIRGQQKIVLRVGNSGGVDILLNGKKLELGGESGEVKTVTIGPAGLVSSPSPPSQSTDQPPS